MIYRKIGNTGMEAGVIGLGGEHLDLKPYEDIKETVDACLYHGINMFDLFMPGTPVREHFGTALKGRRSDAVIQGHIGSVDLNQQYDKTRDLKITQKYFEDLMRCLHTDYIDIGMLFFVDSKEDYEGVFNSEIWPYAQRLKREGKIRAIGASSHSVGTSMKMVENGYIDVLMFSLNLAFDLTPTDDTGDIFESFDHGFKTGEPVIDRQKAALYQLCESRGVAITAMKTYGAGRLFSAERSPFKRAMTPAQCIHYALTRPAVVSAMLGMTRGAEVDAAVSYLTATDEERDYRRIAETFSGSFSGQCVYCNHCQPCPAGIDIGAVHRLLDAATFGKGEGLAQVKDAYGRLKRAAADCTDCRGCEAKCPFGVNITQNMGKARDIFG